MRNTYRVLKMNFPQLNLKQITEDDLWAFVERHEIRVERRMLGVNGYFGKYTPKRKRKPRGLILIDETLRWFEFLSTFLHEVGHYCLHEPRGNREVLFSRRETDVETKQDKEADFFMLLALIPKKTLFEMSQTPFEDLHPYTQEILIKRKKIFDSYGY